MSCFVLIFVFILTAKSQTIVCPHEPEYASLQRVWCKKHSEDCCTGFAFGKKTWSLDNGTVEITNNTPTAFTVSVQNLSQGNGVYWCGLMFKNQTILKLAEKNFSASENLLFGGHIASLTDSLLYVWSLLRWILFPFLPLISFSVCMFRQYTAKKEKVEDGVNVDTPLRAGRERADNTVTEE